MTGTAVRDRGRSPEIRPALARQEPPREKPRVLYIMSAGRSGSTFLDAALGAHAQIAASGELRKLTSPERTGKGRMCSCGRPAEECEYWSQVVGRWREGVGQDAESDYRRSMARYERLRSIARLAAEAVFPSPRFRRYGEESRALFAALRDVSGSTWIADSSKHPIRAGALALTAQTEMALLHLVRDPRGVVWSKTKRARSGRRRRGTSIAIALSAAADWVLLNRLNELVALRHRRALRIRYEDLVADPQATMVRVGALLGVDLEGIGRSMAAGEPIAYQHIVGGNPRRMNGPAPLIPDEEWKQAMPSHLASLVWLVCRPTARRYGYAR